MKFYKMFREYLLEKRTSEQQPKGKKWGSPLKLSGGRVSGRGSSKRGGLEGMCLVCCAWDLSYLPPRVCVSTRTHACIQVFWEEYGNNLGMPPEGLDNL